MSETSIKELEWFDLETRLREIIYQQLEIFNKKVIEDREANASLSSNVDTLEKRISLLEGCVFNDTNPENVLADLKKKISETEGSRKRDVVRFDQDVVSFKEKFKTVSFQISNNSEMIKRLESLQGEFTNDIQRVKQIVEEHQDIILKQIENMNKHFREMNTNYLEKGLKLEEKVNSTLAKLDEINLTMLKYDREFEGVKKNFNDIYIGMNVLKTNKLEFEVYDNDKHIVDARLAEIRSEIQEINGKILVRDSFSDKFMPLQVVGLISDALHYCLDPFAKKRLAEYENNVLKEMHLRTLDVGTCLSREEAISRVLDTIKNVEKRKTDILIEKPKETVSVNKTVENKPAPKMIARESYRENYISRDELQMNFEKFCEKTVEPLLNKTKLELFDKFEVLKKTISSSENECMLYTQQVLREVEDLGAKESKDITDIGTIFSGLKEDSNQIRLVLKEYFDAITSNCQMLVCLVENAQIDIALSEQEEVLADEGTAYASLRTNLKKNNHLSGRILQPIKAHAPATPMLRYRNRKFMRNELIEMKRKMLKLCWESVSKNIPWKQDEFEEIIHEAVKSIETPIQTDVNELPSVISPSFRAKTPYGRKYK